MDIQIYNTLPPAKHRQWQNFLSRMGLSWDEETEQTVLIYSDDELIATGSRKKNLLKCIAVDPAWQGQDLTATLLTQLRQAAFQDGHRRLFLYTKPVNGHLFTPLLFYPVAQTGQVLLMEDRPEGIRNFLNTLPHPKTDGKIGAVVMNCDPFTCGHRHLVETAAAECDWLYVFVLSEDGGWFSPQDRIEMVKRGTADLTNITVLPTDAYLISSATFPTYFLKDRDQSPQIQCALDIEIFARYFVPRLQIRRRYVGQEPISPMTAMYNEALKANLPQKGVQVVEIPRLEQTGQPISASRVRALVEAGQWEQVQALVPQTTYDYLMKLQQEDAL